MSSMRCCPKVENAQSYDADCKVSDCESGYALSESFCCKIQPGDYGGYAVTGSVCTPNACDFPFVRDPATGLCVSDISEPSDPTCPPLPNAIDLYYDCTVAECVTGFVPSRESVSKMVTVVLYPTLGVNMWTTSSYIHLVKRSGRARKMRSFFES